MSRFYTFQQASPQNHLKQTMSSRRCWPLSFVLVLLAWHRFNELRTFAPPPRELKGLWDDLWDQTLPAGEDLSNIGTNDVLRSFKRTLDEDMFQEIEMDGVPKSAASIGGGKLGGMEDCSLDNLSVWRELSSVPEVAQQWKWFTSYFGLTKCIDSSLKCKCPLAHLHQLHEIAWFWRQANKGFVHASPDSWPTR